MANPTEPVSQRCNRRTFLAAALGTAALAPGAAQTTQRPTVSPDATPRDWSGAQPVRYPDPDIVALDNRFRRYIVGNTVIKRLHTGTLWAEGPAWNGVGRYLVWSDIPNNVQMRWLEEDGHVTVFRNPSGYSNGNTFDYEGRQLSCEHGGRRVVRYEPNGSVTVIADKFEGKRLNSPNDIAVHPDGSIWFTDPPYGIIGNYEGFRAEKELKEAVYRVDGKTSQMEKLTEEMTGPNGICFSPDYKKVYVADTGSGREIRVWDIDGKAIRNGKRFVQLDVPGSGAPAAADGIRCDVDGNIWAGARPGVQVINAGGERIGIIRLPENCANICFGGTKRNRLFMAASQSLYSVYVLTAGAHIA
ncbi:MAG TPA: SMP-30/gluconolactonase/LRE family protein [Bryobacteraceae bacterium]|nr:SMP-30/gluconolactonase/LRE family protein [Bryobacteraceae bacterium]